MLARHAAASGSLRNPQAWEQEQIATNLLERHEFANKQEGSIAHAPNGCAPRGTAAVGESSRRRGY